MLKNLGKIEVPILLFGGVYSNLEALKSLKREALKLGIKRFINTGDIVGYCAQPEACVNEIKTWPAAHILGNVEIQLKDGFDDCGCDFSEESPCDLMSKQWYPFAQKNTSKRSLQWFSTLPDQLTFTLCNKKVLVLHGGIKNVSEFIFKSTPWNIKQAYFDAYNVDVIIAGHCGLPFVDSKNGKHWINPGVIGMPANDNQQCTWYGILKKNSFELKPLEYNWQQTQTEMRAYKLPEPYALTLETGLWDNMDILPEAERKEQGIAIKPFTIDL